jgi:hypothetical protein
MDEALRRVTKHRDDIVAVAERLLSSDSLSGAELDALLSASSPNQKT